MPGYILYCKFKKIKFIEFLKNQLRMHAFKNGSKFCTIETNDVKSVFHIALQELYSFIFFNATYNCQ